MSRQIRLKKRQRPLETVVNETQKVLQDHLHMIRIPNTKLFTYFLLEFEWCNIIFDNCLGIFFTKYR